MNILVIDDDPDIAEAIALILEMDGHGVTVVGDGQSALALLSAGDLPDALVVDFLMPHMNGDEVLRKLWEMRPEARNVPVVLCTAGVLSDDVKALTPYLLEKPFEIDALWRIVEQACCVSA